MKEGDQRIRDLNMLHCIYTDRKVSLIPKLRGKAEPGKITKVYNPCTDEIEASLGYTADPGQPATVRLSVSLSLCLSPSLSLSLPHTHTHTDTQTHTHTHTHTHTQEYVLYMKGQDSYNETTRLELIKNT
jgi:hypothetical protein